MRTQPPANIQVRPAKSLAAAGLAAADESDKHVSRAALRLTRSVKISWATLVQASRLVEALEKQV
jgi:hypothetical protein